MTKLSRPEGTTRCQSLGHLKAGRPAPLCGCQVEFSGHARGWDSAIGSHRETAPRSW